MTEVLSFDLSLRRDGFALSLTERIPLDGVTAVTGPSGAGKTTLLRCLAGLERGASGSVRLGDDVLQDETRFVPPHARGVGYVFQEARLFPHMSVARNLAYGARRRGVAQERIEEIVRLLDLAPLLDRRPGGLSGGESRRVALGRVLASQPRVLFLDEPMTGLDSARKAEIMPHIVRATHGLGLPALLVSHAEDEIQTLADRVLKIEEGGHAGWGRVPVRLPARVVERCDHGAVLVVGEARLILPLPASAERNWALAVPPDGALVSTGPPGPGNALASLQARVGAVPGDGTVALEVAGHTVAWPWPEGRIVPPPGSDVWFTILKVYPRPTG